LRWWRSTERRWRPTAFATCYDIANGGVEYNPLARPLVRTAGVQVVSVGALFGAEIATAYLLHTARHTMMERGVLAAGAVMNGFGSDNEFQTSRGWVTGVALSEAAFLINNEQRDMLFERPPFRYEFFLSSRYDFL